jgi:hypothetical protein
MSFSKRFCTVEMGRLGRTGLGKTYSLFEAPSFFHACKTLQAYGVIGLTDFTMWPLIRPGSIVQIDGSQRKVLPIKWENEHERPIYFIELSKCKCMHLRFVMST